jgi:hypothetical protein
MEEAHDAPENDQSASNAAAGQSQPPQLAQPPAASSSAPGQNQAAPTAGGGKEEKTNVRELIWFLLAFVAGGAICGIVILVAGRTIGCNYQCLPGTFQFGVIFSIIVVAIGGIIAAFGKKIIALRLYKLLVLGCAGFLVVSLFYFFALVQVQGEGYRLPQCTPTPTPTLTPTPTPSPIPAISAASCPGDADFTFEDGTSGNWIIRYDGDQMLGDSLKYSEAAPCAGKPVKALEFNFELGAGYDPQIGLDGKGVPIAGGMSAWLYAPEGAPPGLAARCFVMEVESRGYAWYETGSRLVVPGEWVKISCPIRDFHWKQGGDGNGWRNPPQFIGLAFKDIQGNPYPGKVYVTSIDIK